MTLRGLAETLFDAIEKEGARAPRLSSEERGTVCRVLRGVVEVEGFTQAASDEVIAFEGGAMGLALDLVPGLAGIVLLHDPQGMRPGDHARRTRRVALVPTGEALLGRVINPLGHPLDNLGPVAADRLEPVETPAPPIMERAPVTHPLQTGIKAVDALVPIGRGQRELILGDRQTGKTAVAVDTILNQKGAGILSVYCAIGQRGDAVARVIARLRDSGVMENCVVVVAGGEEPPGLQYIAPYAATTIAERFMRSGRNALIVYDDLTRHARAYRELSLLLRRPPGREAYPGDIFYLHARMLERATQLRESAGGGSLRKRGRRFADRSAYRRDAGAEPVSLYPHQPHLHHRWADLSLANPLPAWTASGGGCWAFSLSRRRQGAAARLPRSGGAAKACLCSV
jgi:F-type H+-transporting ATPase subunit alpha